MFVEIISSKKYWKTVTFIGIGFVIVFSVIEHLMRYKGLSLDMFMEERISEGKWVRYFLSRVTGGLMYGVIMGYYFELRKRKSNR